MLRALGRREWEGARSRGRRCPHRQEQAVKTPGSERQPGALRGILHSVEQGTRPLLRSALAPALEHTDYVK